MGLEGLVSKRRDHPYQAGRSKHWIKVKPRRRRPLWRCLFVADRFQCRGPWSWRLGPCQQIVNMPSIPRLRDRCGRWCCPRVLVCFKWIAASRIGSPSFAEFAGVPSRTLQRQFRQSCGISLGKKIPGQSGLVKRRNSSSFNWPFFLTSRRL